MALLFQSNPDQWDLRGHMEGGKFVSWFVSRYQAFMYPGAPVLLWEAQGSKPKVVKGLYGWGITTDKVKPDNKGKLRIRLQYVERWVSKFDVDKELKEHIAPIPADDVLSLGTWQNHLLKVMPIGTNFLVTPEQLEELNNDIVRVRFPKSQFHKAVKLDLKGEKLDPRPFISHEPIIEGKE